ncbi:MAG: cbb3-type cytochrome c oxidase subunit I, partial [Deltaproteobacteria bacterium]|nr:cbb3-type cytochrome c oxidase subunit I [Deltaproteobacteria bacterium]
FLGFNVTFLPQFWLGKMGMPRRYHDYGAEFTTWNMISTVGSWLIGAGFLIMAVYFIWSLFKGAKASNNPWNAKTLEWQISSPPTTHNFDKIPTITEGPYQYGILK